MKKSCRKFRDTHTPKEHHHPVQCEVIADASHFVNLDQPETFNRVLKAFLG